MIKVINESNSNEFENEVNDWLDEGYKISSTSCGCVKDPDGSIIGEYYIAILYKEEVEG